MNAAEAVGIVNAERSSESRPVDYRDVELAAARAAIAARDEEIMQLRAALRETTGHLTDFLALFAGAKASRDRGLDVIERRRRAVSLEQAALNAVGSAAVLAAIETVRR